ncbi:protein-L-isoaspartate(D-aspartate) O-methyltransferase [Candidatus Omnitrophota bacterium]
MNIKKIIIFILVVVFGVAGVIWARDMDFFAQKKAMVELQIKRRGVTDQRVLDAILKVERHVFVPRESRRFAYRDGALPIGMDQTISQPYIVALMTQLGRIKDDDNVLEIGTGSGYQAAILAELSKNVYTIEIIPELARRAENLLKELGYKNIKVKQGDGYLGWPEYAPFDVIIVTAAPIDIPKELVKQLTEGGRMVIPVGKAGSQILKLLIKKSDAIVEEDVIPVRFVPMVHR